MNEIKKVFKWWSASRSEKIETWLEDMEAQGWHLLRVGQGGTWFVFQKGVPRKMSYCVDYQTKIDRNYMGIFEDAGWEKIFTIAGWYIWRKSYLDSKPAIFTDIDSLIERNNRLLGVFSVLFATQIPLIFNLHNSPLLMLTLPVLVLLAITFYQLAAANKKLKNKRNVL